jgi:flagellar biosynthesis/type III secretory pathway chaperone
MSATQSEPTTAPVANAAEAEALVTQFIDIMDKLIGVIEQETELVRAGRLTAAMEVAEAKSDLTRRYMADVLRLQTSRPLLARFAAETLAALRQRHETFRSLLQVNQTVLATAHAVSEGIVRGVSNELARKQTPQTYGASGRSNAPRRSAAAPLAVSRTL